MGNTISVLKGLVDDFIAVGTIILINMFPGEALILATICDECESFMSDQIRITLGWIGITPTDTVTVQMQDQKLISDTGFYKNLMVQVALAHQQTQMGIIDLLAVKSQGVRGSMSKYHNYGKKTYLDGEPTSTIDTIGVNIVAIDTAITTEVGVAIDVQQVKVKIPTETEWVSYKLTKLYGYNPTTQYLVYTDTYRYIMTGFVYNFITGFYDTTITREAVSTVTTDVVVTPIDATTDNVYTKVTTVITAYEGVVSTTITETNVTVAKGTVVNSTTVVVTNITINTTVLQIVSYSPRLSYVATYNHTGYTDTYYWIYMIGSGNTVLDNARNSLSKLDLLPIVELRSNSISIDSNKLSTRYIQSKKILSLIGIDVDTMLTALNGNSNISSVTSAYVYFGAELGSTNPLQAKLVYATLDYIYQDSALVTGAPHTIRVGEGNYNSAISWTEQTHTIVTRTGVPIGKCEGGTGYDAGTMKYYAWVRKQETSSQYVEYRVYNVSATTLITKGVMYDIAFRVLSDTQTIVMPMSIYFLKNFSPIEQAKLLPEILRMVTYAADIQHLKYYQTPEFMQLIQIVVVIIGIVLFILTLPAGGSGGYAWLAWAGGVLLALGAAYALQQLLLTIDNPQLRAIVAAIAVIAMAYATGQIDSQSIYMIMGYSLTAAVTSYYEASSENIAESFQKLQQEDTAFQTERDKREAELTEKNNVMQSTLSVGEVQKLMKLEPTKAYIEGPELSIYRAVSMQYDWGLLKGELMYKGAFDYDKYYRLGIV